MKKDAYKEALEKIVNYVPEWETKDFEVVISLKRIANEVLQQKRPDPTYSGFSIS